MFTLTKGAKPMIYIITGAFILLDFITGLVKAFKTKQFTSSVMRQGLFHKAGSVLVVMFGALVDYAQIYIDLGVSLPVATTICVYICLMEIGSIIENVCEINPRIVPNKIQSYFQKLNSKENDEKDVDNLDDSHGSEG